MRTNWRLVIATAMLSAVVFLQTARADERLTQIQNSLGNTTFGGHANSVITESRREPSGITGQVFLILPTLNLDEGLGDYDTEPMQLPLWVYKKIGNHFRHIGSVETAQDGSFSFDAPPGTYMLEPDPTSGYWLGGVIGLYTDTLEIAVLPRQITYDEIYVLSAVSSPFPGLN